MPEVRLSSCCYNESFYLDANYSATEHFLPAKLFVNSRCIQSLLGRLLGFKSVAVVESHS